jgi:hypothetical protein
MRAALRMLTIVNAMVFLFFTGLSLRTGVRFETL